MNKVILLVDDEIDLAETLTFRLEASSYKVITAYDGIEALNKARQERPDLIILDLMLPKMDGYKVCKILKRDQKYADIPIIMFTARAQESDEIHGYKCGANAYIIKPFDPQILLAKIKELLPE